MSGADRLRVALSETIQTIHQRGWAPGTGGNFSAVLAPEPLTLLMTPSGADKGRIQPADLVVVNEQGQVVEGDDRASAETLLHLTLVQATGARVVLHTHSVFNTLLSERYTDQGGIAIAGYEMLKGLEGIRTHDTTVDLPIVPNSQDMQTLSDQVRSRLNEKKTVAYGLLIAGHGLYAWGDSLFQAKRHLEVWEFLLELTYRKLALSH